MQYLISFLEGIITFVSPCILPMLPIYLSYFAGSKYKDMKKTLLGAVGFVTGFSAVFTLMGALAGISGSFLIEYRRPADIICGVIIILFGLNYLGVLNFNIFRGGIKLRSGSSSGFFPSMLLGVVFSVGWTPCAGAFLGSALLLASSSGSF